MAVSAHLLCVRHGLSTWNLERRWQGRADPPLSDVGEQGAVELAEALATTVAHGSNASVWSSDLQRARATAEIIAERLGAGPVTVDGRLRETDVGPWQGLTSPEIEERLAGLPRRAAGDRTASSPRPTCSTGSCPRSSTSPARSPPARCRSSSPTPACCGPCAGTPAPSTSTSPTSPGCGSPSSPTPATIRFTGLFDQRDATRR